ncbi:DUF3619 family protein [Thiolapillus sp.]
MDEFEKKLKQALDNKARGMDAATLSRLRRARETALDTPLPWWRSIQAHAGVSIDLGGVLSHHPAPAALALGVLVLVTLLMLFPMFTGSSGSTTPDTLELLEIISLDTDLDLVQEMDFYRWLEEQAPGESGQ